VLILPSIVFFLASFIEIHPGFSVGLMILAACPSAIYGVSMYLPAGLLLLAARFMMNRQNLSAE